MGNDQVKRIGKFYSIAGTLVVLFIAFNMVVENFVYLRSRDVYEENTAAVQTLSEINGKLTAINERVMLMVAGLAPEDELTQINVDFGEISALKTEFLAQGSQPEIELRRFNQAFYAIQGYQRKIQEVGPSLMQAGFETAHDIYTQELDPLRQCAGEMLEAAVEIGSADAEKKVKSSSLMHGVAQLVLIVVTVGGVIGLFIAGRAQIRGAIEMQLKQEELEEASDRLLVSRQKLVDSAKMNILTALPNRYGLEERLKELLGKQSFYIAVYDMDHFRGVNDTYGYEYGDEYLVIISERLKTAYGDQAEFFKICGDEFCAIFTDDASDMQVKTLVEQIRQNIGGNTQVSGMMLSSGVSGSLYHVLPSESKDVGALLRKGDTAMHQAKLDGGNRLYYI